MSELTRNQLERTADHEAGHLLFCLAKNLIVYRWNIGELLCTKKEFRRTRDDSRVQNEGSGMVRYGPPRVPWEDCLMRMAGPAAGGDKRFLPGKLAEYRIMES